MFRLTLAFCCLPLFLLAMTHRVPAQETTYYPGLLYPGDNIITISDSVGIETISFTASPHTHAEAPSLKGCPKSVNIRVRVDDPTTEETVDIRVNNCRGEFSSKTLASESWSMRQEKMPTTMVGRDTCLTFNLTTTHQTIIDSIYVDNPDMYVMMPPRIEGNWTALPETVFHYQICYHPQRAEKVTTTLRLKIRRDAPNQGLTHYVVDRAIVATAMPLPAPKQRDTTVMPALPPVNDPVTFRTIIVPTAESIGEKRLFVSVYDIAGVMAGYGVTDRFSVILGGAFVPAAISKLATAAILGKYELYTAAPLNAAVGGLYAYTSTKTSDISTTAFFGMISYGDKARRISVAGGYSWKHHKSVTEEYDRNAVVVTIGGDLTIARGWKLAAEGYYIESSGISPATITAKYFTERFALDFGFGINFSGSSDIQSSGLTGSINSLPFAPVVAVTWVW